MKLVFFIHQDASKKSADIEKIIDQNFTGSKCQTLRTFTELKSRLREHSSFTDEELFILFVDSNDRLDQLMSLAGLLGGKPIILILPDLSKATLSKASRLFPRFFTSMSKSYVDLCAVINKKICFEQEKKHLNKGGNSDAPVA